MIASMTMSQSARSSSPVVVLRAPARGVAVRGRELALLDGLPIEASMRARPLAASSSRDLADDRVVTGLGGHFGDAGAHQPGAENPDLTDAHRVPAPPSRLGDLPSGLRRPPGLSAKLAQRQAPGEPWAAQGDQRRRRGHLHPPVFLPVLEGLPAEAAFVQRRHDGVQVPRTVGVQVREEVLDRRGAHGESEDPLRPVQLRGSRRRQGLDDDRDALPSADARAGEPVAGAAAAQLLQERQRAAGAGRRRAGVRARSLRRSR